ncbi:hypothetical protein LIER_43909 [Lithospermum erythrorhizon]|uniref:Secreted protein n=1 Tax=Lithospermum erythrorhizon TaxID=34254 RepID=A0AAV3R6M4_LITER
MRFCSVSLSSCSLLSGSVIFGGELRQEVKVSAERTKPRKVLWSSFENVDERLWRHKNKTVTLQLSTTSFVSSPMALGSVFIELFTSFVGI